MSATMILPGTGRGTMRSMVEGGFHQRTAWGDPPPPACGWSPSPQAGRI